MVQTVNNALPPGALVAAEEPRSDARRVEVASLFFGYSRSSARTGTQQPFLGELEEKVCHGFL